MVLPFRPAIYGLLKYNVQRNTNQLNFYYNEKDFYRIDARSERIYSKCT
mgnify:CR=1 FL=1